MRGVTAFEAGIVRPRFLRSWQSNKRYWTLEIASSLVLLAMTEMRGSIRRRGEEDSLGFPAIDWCRLL